VEDNRSEDRIIDAMSAKPLVGIVMGSRSDYAVMRAAVEVLREFGVEHEARVVSAHRTPDLLFEYAEAAVGRGLRVIIAGAGGAAHLPGMMAAKTVVPVLGVPIAATALQGMDALLSIAQMPKGVPVGTMAIGASGAANAALLAVAMLATGDAELRAKLVAWREARRDEVLAMGLDGLDNPDVSNVTTTKAGA
jgi:5-(carboxyamino)imidazole ribonucleotide mutase